MAYFKVKILKKDLKRRQSNKNKNLARIPYKKLLIITLWLAFMVGIILIFYALCNSSPYFIVKDVVIIGKVPDSSVDYGVLERMIIDKNIFDIDLKAIRDYMLGSYQELLELQLTRSFPDSVIAVTALRKPVAQIYQGRYYPIDRDGIILSGVKDYSEGDLPIISGVRSELDGQIGSALDSNRVKKALLLLEEINASGILDGHALVEIDLSNIRNAVFFLEEGLEVKIGHEDFASRLDNLKKILHDSKLKTSDIRYIDLRFKEPVIGPRWKK